MTEQPFAAALRDAQSGRREGFVTLFRRHQPALLRTLHGLDPGLADRAAAATWRQVVGDLPSYTGDEYGFRVWVITLGRLQLRGLERRTRATGGARPRLVERQARAWAATAKAADRAAAGPTGAALARVHELPSDQAEAVLLRVVAGLDVLTVADRLQRSSAETRRLYQTGLRAAARSRTPEGKGAGGRSTARQASRQLVPLADATLVDTLLDDPDAAARLDDGSTTQRRLRELIAALRAPAGPDDLQGEDAALAAFGAGAGSRGRLRRRTVGVAVMSAATTVMTITTAAAATGTLPNTLQEWAHNYVGAPAPPRPGSHPQLLPATTTDGASSAAHHTTAPPSADSGGPAWHPPATTRPWTPSSSPAANVIPPAVPSATAPVTAAQGPPPESEASEEPATDVPSGSAVPQGSGTPSETAATDASADPTPTVTVTVTLSPSAPAASETATEPPGTVADPSTQSPSAAPGSPPNANSLPDPGTSAAPDAPAAQG